MAAHPRAAAGAPPPAPPAAADVQQKGTSDTEPEPEEGSLLLPGGPQQRGEGQMPGYSAVLNLTHTIIGAGTLTLPLCFAKSGWLPANCVAVLMAALTTYSVYLLVVASDRVGGHGARSFEGLGWLTCGVAGSVYAEASFAFGGLGTLTGYMIFIGKLVAQVAGLGDDQRYIPIVVATCGVIMPLAWPRRINALRWVSFAAICAVLYILVMYVVFAARIGKYDDDPTGSYTYEGVTVATWSSHSVDTLNLLIGAFAVQNTCLPIYGELRDRSPRRMIAVTLCAMLLSFVVYEVVGVSGYVLLGGNVQGDSLLDFDDNFVSAHPWTKVPRDVAKVLMASNLALAAPLAIWPFRSAVCSIVNRARGGWAGPARGADDASDAMFRAVTVVSLCVVAFLAVEIPNVTIPLGVVNSLAGGSMIFVMPGLFYLNSIPNKAERWAAQHRGAHAMIVLGVGVMGLGFGMEVRNLIADYG